MKIRMHYYILKVLIKVYPRLFYRYLGEYRKVAEEWKAPTKCEAWMVDYEKIKNFFKIGDK